LLQRKRQWHAFFLLLVVVVVVFFVVLVVVVVLAQCLVLRAVLRSVLQVPAAGQGGL
jgi:hypothetical protein